MWEDYREMFDGVCAPESLREEVLNVKKESFRTKRRAPVLVLVAVAAVLLAGTAFAAVIERLNMNVFSNEEEAGYIVSGSMTKYPLSAFSPALLEVSGNRGNLAVVEDIKFNTWDELCAFLGQDIPCAWPGNGEGWTGAYRVYLFHTGSDRLWGVEIYSSQTAPDLVFAQIEVYIRTENWTGDMADFGLHGTPDGSYFQLGSYQMANGLAAEVVQYTGSEEYPHAYCGAYFMKDGIMYSVTANGTTSTQEETLSRLYAILDAYE